VLGILFVSVSVGLSNFAASIGIGLSGVDARIRLRIGLAFGFFEALMPVVGLVIGQTLAGNIGHTGRYFGGGLLVLTGAYIIIKEVRDVEAVPRAIKDIENVPQNDLLPLLTVALALSIDNLIVGFALSLYHVNIALAAVTIGVVSVTMSLIGLELGSRLGQRLEKWSEELSGVALILIGLAIAAGIL
jgi:manganese efflux pump family protein